LKKCPKCGNWTFALNSRREVMTCRRVSCKYEEPISVNTYLEKNNVLPKLVETLKLNGKAREPAVLKATS
jgi:DNA-directed RNA polymerase subunit M/transcription elongation factor TFIIS